jgi:hydroxyethylthiazole kinase
VNLAKSQQEMSKVTGTGCMLSGILTLFISANRGNEIVAAATTTCVMGIGQNGKI